MTISAIAIFNPRKIRSCSLCVLPIRFDCVRLYGAAERGDKPYAMYVCHDCATKASYYDLKIKAAVETLDRGPTGHVSVNA